MGRLSIEGCTIYTGMDERRIGYGNVQNTGLKGLGRYFTFLQRGVRREETEKITD